MLHRIRDLLFRFLQAPSRNGRGLFHDHEKGPDHMATKKTAQTLEQLQEEALQYEVDIYDPDDQERELPYEELLPLVEAAKTQAVEEHQRQQEAAKEARKPMKASKGKGKAAAGASGRAGASAGMRAKGTQDASEAFDLSFDELKSKIATVGHELRSELRMPEATEEEYRLAYEHGYGIAIPGAKPYRTSIQMRDAFSGEERPAGSVIFLTDAHASNKLDYLEPIDTE